MPHYVMRELFLNKVLQKLRLSQQMAKLCRKLKWLLFFWDTAYMYTCTSIHEECVKRTKTQKSLCALLLPINSEGR